jgi:hypothetical protein
LKSLFLQTDDKFPEEVKTCCVRDTAWVAGQLADPAFPFSKEKTLAPIGVTLMKIITITITISSSTTDGPKCNKKFPFQEYKKLFRVALQQRDNKPVQSAPLKVQLSL